MRKLNYIFALILLSAGDAFGQAEMADSFRAEGKIYVVVAIIVIILAGVFAYLFALDRKIRKLEDRFQDKH